MEEMSEDLFEAFQPPENPYSERMLPFELQIFEDIVHNDGLVVAAKGINLDLVILNVLKVYCDPGNLVIVLNSEEAEEKYFTNKLKSPDVHHTDSNTKTEDREDSYSSGGIHFVTTRVLVVDMLKRRIPIEKITGFIVLRAHRIFESCQEAFVLRLFRQINKTGFIKAFSNNAQSYTIGFGHVERVMRALFVKELFLWPRFHSLVIQSFKKHEPQVIELHVPISDNMKKIQTYILDLMNFTVKEIKRINKTVELQEITVENCLTKNFHKIIQAQMDPIWNQLSNKSRQLITDLKNLRHLIISMLHTDSVSFYNLLNTYRSLEYAKTATWILSQSADLLFSQASSLLFSGDRQFNAELCIKWKIVLELLKNEIPKEINKLNPNENITLILCYDNRTCHQLNEILTQGPHKYLFFKALKYGISFKGIDEKFKNCGNIPEDQDVLEKTKKQSENDEENSDFRDNYILTMSQQEGDNEMKETSDESSIIFEPFAEMENMNITQICEKATAPKIIIQTFKGSKTYANLQQTLEDLRPSFIIMYHCNMTAIREIEMYEAHRDKNQKLKIYFLIQTETVEEQSSLTSLRREKEAFEFLIRTKSTMVVPTDQDGKSDLCAALQNITKSPTKNTRHGGGSGSTEETTNSNRFIIVDMREFRSELPALIHKRGITIEPLTITVGDYILTPEICIERKSLSDLVGSLQSGRLYQQCTQMTRFYLKPMLLIEFDQNRPFSWQNNYMISSDTNSFDIQKKLLLLTLHFPKLKLIWSPSPYASAQLFDELKEGKDEPDIQYAASISGDDIDAVETKYNSGIYDFIQKLPGITSKNIDRFLRGFKNLDNVIKTSEEELEKVLENSKDANVLFNIIHKDYNPAEDGEKVKSKFKGKSRFKSGKNK